MSFQLIVRTITPITDVVSITQERLIKKETNYLILHGYLNSKISPPTRLFAPKLQFDSVDLWNDSIGIY